MVDTNIQEMRKMDM